MQVNKAQLFLVHRMAKTQFAQDGIATMRELEKP